MSDLKKKTTKDLVDLVSDKIGLSKRSTKEILKTVLDSISELMKDNDELSVTEFGKFTAKILPGRTVSWMGTSEKKEIPASRVVRFKFYKKFKDSVR